MKNEFTVTITNCGCCPYSADYTDNQLYCEYDGENCNTSCPEGNREAHKEENTPIPDWCPALAAKTHRPAKEIAYDITMNDKAYHDHLLDYPDFATNNVKYWLEAEATPELKKEVMRFVCESKRIRGRQ